MKYLFLCCLLSLSFLSVSRGLLEFNDVKLVSVSETVPAGKVWKLVGVAGQRTDNQTAATSLNYSPSTHQIIINGNAIDVTQVLSTSVGSGRSSVYSATSSLPTTFPLWVPSGTQLEASTNVTYISVIEFNVVP